MTGCKYNCLNTIKYVTCFTFSSVNPPNVIKHAQELNKLLHNQNAICKVQKGKKLLIIVIFRSVPKV